MEDSSSTQKDCTRYKGLGSPYSFFLAFKLPSGYVKIENDPVEIVDLPIFFRMVDLSIVFCGSLSPETSTGLPKQGDHRHDAERPGITRQSSTPQRHHGDTEGRHPPTTKEFSNGLALSCG